MSLRCVGVCAWKCILDHCTLKFLNRAKKYQNIAVFFFVCFFNELALSSFGHWEIPQVS